MTCGYDDSTINIVLVVLLLLYVLLLTVTLIYPPRRTLLGSTSCKHRVHATVLQLSHAQSITQVTAYHCGVTRSSPAAGFRASSLGARGGVTR